MEIKHVLMVLVYFSIYKTIGAGGQQNQTELPTSSPVSILSTSLDSSKLKTNLSNDTLSTASNNSSATELHLPKNVSQNDSSSRNETMNSGSREGALLSDKSRMNQLNHTSHPLLLNDIEASSMDEGLDTWEAPSNVQKNFPYYLSGYDDDNRPIWISEMGKYRVRELIEKGPENVPLLDKYIKQAAHRILQSLHEQTTPDNQVNEIVFIIDFDGLDLAQVAHTPTILYVLNLIRMYRDLIENHLGETVIINANYFAEMLINVCRPVFGRVMERTEVYGTQSSKWMPVLRRLLPEDTIPTWYGGHPHYKPIKVYG